MGFHGTGEPVKFTQIDLKKSKQEFLEGTL